MRKNILDYITPEFLERESKLKTFRQIARELDLDVTSITYWSRKWGISSKYTTVKNEVVTDEQKILLVASVLGDGSLDKIKNTVYFREHHSLAQREYVDWKFSKLCNLSNSPPCVTSDVYGFRLATNKFTTYLYSEFYIGGEKSIPTCLKDYLHPMLLAVHYFDDGWINNKKDTMCISTAQFSKDENDHLAHMYNDFFNVNFKTQPHWSARYNKYYYYLRADKKSSSTISRIISPYVVPCLKYKLVEGVTTMHVPH